MIDPIAPTRQHRRLAAILATLAVLLATFFITASYKVYSQTYDEAAHLACGMEWLSLGTYDYEALHPPLARAATALFPFLEGARSEHQPTMLGEGNALLHLHNQYWRNLTLSRLGVLPFFWLMCFVVYRFVAERFGPWQAAVSVILLAFCPPVLAHSGLATTDAPLMAMFTWSLLRFWRFLEKPTAAHAVLAGLTFGLAAITKFTELPFFLFAAFLLLVIATLRTRRLPVPVQLLLLAILVVPPTIWAGYRFSYAPVFNHQSMSPSAALKLQTVSPRERQLLTETKVPANQFFRGLIMAKGTGSVGRLSYLLGQTYVGGRRAFFPVALAVKTPLPMLLLFVCGLGLAGFVGRLRANPAFLVPVLGVLCPLLVGMAGQMNIGLRHVLPVYPFMAMIGAIGAVGLWNFARGSLGIVLRAVVVLLLGWDLIGCARVAPDFLPYFNEIAARHADYYLVNSDLDWGQDLARLDTTLHQDHVSSVTLGYFGDPGASLNDFPPVHVLAPGERPTGWVAVSETYVIEQPEIVGWLNAYPYTLVGHSIRLYHLGGTAVTP